MVSNLVMNNVLATSSMARSATFVASDRSVRSDARSVRSDARSVRSDALY